MTFIADNIEHDPSRKAICQGDMYLVPIKEVPKDAKLVAPENGHFIITHSETGHHHVIKERPGIRQFTWEDQFRGFIELSLEEKLDHLEHLRANDTHEAQVVPAGPWLIQRQAAYTPGGWERARD